MTAYGYCRVSTTRQAGEGESLAVQQRQLEGYCQMLDLKLDKVFVEKAVSGSVPLADRPQGRVMLAALQAGDAIVTSKLDRMFRSAVDALNELAKLKEQGVSLHMIDLGGDVTGNGISKLVFTILSAVAEAERDRIRERITQVKRDQRQRGRWLGGRKPFGWSIGEDGQLVKDAEEQEAIARAKRMHKAGKSLRRIAAALGERGQKISHEGVKRVLEANLKTVVEAVADKRR
jgi:DNA invertase Pin-like site-specific DNA recombinase